LLALPFLQYILGALLVAYILYPVQGRLERRVSPPVAAFALVLLAVAVVIVPLVIIVVVVASDARRLIENTDSDSFQTAELERLIEEQTGVSVDITSTLADSAQSIGGIALEQSTAWFSALTHTLVGLGLAIFLLYYLLKDGGSLLAWIRS